MDDAKYRLSLILFRHEKGSYAAIRQGKRRERIELKESLRASVLGWVDSGYICGRRACVRTCLCANKRKAAHVHAKRVKNNRR